MHTDLEGSFPQISQISADLWEGPAGFQSLRGCANWRGLPAGWAGMGGELLQKVAKVAKILEGLPAGCAGMGGENHRVTM